MKSNNQYLIRTCPSVQAERGDMHQTRPYELYYSDPKRTSYLHFHSSVHKHLKGIEHAFNWTCGWKKSVLNHPSINQKMFLLDKGKCCINYMNIENTNVKYPLVFLLPRQLILSTINKIIKAKKQEYLKMESYMVLVSFVMIISFLYRSTMRCKFRVFRLVRPMLCWPKWPMGWVGPAHVSTI